MASWNARSLYALLLSASSVLAVPVFPPGASAVVPRQGPGACRNQSCEIAAIAGSTGAQVYPYDNYPLGGNSDGNCCIIRYFPAIKDELYAAVAGQEAYCASHGGVDPLDGNPPNIDYIPVTLSSDNSTNAVPKRAATTCKPNILIFVKGTFEPFALGITVGPMLAAVLNSAEWDVRGVNYDSSYANDFCLGLPGGITARQVLARAVSDCPDSLIAMSGYSQGAMVVRNALARAPASDVAHVKNVVNFGDPFDGADIGQYTGPRHIFCMTTDGVCTGNFDITVAHLSYAEDVLAAARILMATEV